MASPSASSSSSSSSHLVLCLLSLLCFISSSANQNPNSITISLNQFTKNSSSDPLEHLTRLASSSLTRAKHLKNPNKKTHDDLSQTSLSAQSYGGYSISLSFGTPPQTIPFVMDTGSDLVWFPCTHRYLCKNCSFSPNPNSKIPSFIPKMSSSSKLIGCQNPKCSWVHGSDSLSSRCRDCELKSGNCSQICPPYLVIYGSGSTGGVLLSETLNLPGKTTPDFVVGCSLFSSRAPAGIAGFGRGPASLPSQLRLSKFSYCLLSHRFDDTSKTSSLVLAGSGSDSGQSKTGGVSYTPLLKNPVAGKPAFSVYYYTGLRKITVGGKHVKIPYKYLSTGSDGNGGAIVDSGSTFTFMEGAVFEPVAREIANQTSVRYKRVKEVEARTGLRPCFDVSAEKDISVPPLAFHFKGGAVMDLPLANYFSLVGSNGVVCMTIITDGDEKGEMSSGPSVILGNFQMQNFYVEYDLKNERLGFRRQTSC